MERVFAIGDVHGCNRTFRKLLFEKVHVAKSDIVVCLGDYVDRGPDSKGVVDTILELRASGFQVQTLRGNHEQLMMDSPDSSETFEQWIFNGGLETLKSFGVGSYDDFASEYKRFFDATEYYFEAAQCIFVHAGLDFTSGNEFSNTEAMLWSRNMKIDPVRLGQRRIIHGHTPKPAELIPDQTKASVVNIDGGCVYAARPGYGHLFALEVNSMEFTGVRNIDM